jgi:hypothetical protein
MTVATARISESLQTLIDSRLDTIDRMLMGRVGRAERMAIVREVPVILAAAGASVCMFICSVVGIARWAQPRARAESGPWSAW